MQRSTVCGAACDERARHAAAVLQLAPSETGHRAPRRLPGAGAAGAIVRRRRPASPHPARAHFFAFFSSAMRPDTDFWATAAAARTVSARRGAVAPVPKAPAPRHRLLRSACCMAAPAARWTNNKGGSGAWAHEARGAAPLENKS
jgi:hypothetical protein